MCLDVEVKKNYMLLCKRGFDNVSLYVLVVLSKEVELSTRMTAPNGTLLTSIYIPLTNTLLSNKWY